MGIRGIILVLLLIIVIIFSISNLQNITLVFFGVKTISFPLSFAVLSFILMGFLSSLTIQFLNQIFNRKPVAKYPEESQYSAPPPPPVNPPSNQYYNDYNDDYNDNFYQKRSQSQPLKQPNLTNDNPVDFPEYSDNLNKPEIEDNFSYQEAPKYSPKNEQTEPEIESKTIREKENLSPQPDYSRPEIPANQEIITSESENINKTNHNLEQEELETNDNKEKESTQFPLKTRQASPYSFTSKEKTIINNPTYPANLRGKNPPVSSSKEDREDDVYTASYRIIKSDSPKNTPPEFDDDEDWDF